MLDKLLGLKKKSRGAIHRFNDNWSFIGWDIHSHILPGIDDGPATLENSIAIINELKNMGYKGAVTTPHIRSDHYPNTPQTIQTALDKVKTALKESNIDFQVKAAAEYYIDDSFISLLQKEPLLTIDQNHLLIEFSLLFEPKIKDLIPRIQSAGYVPVLAHAERYLYYHSNLDKYKSLKDKGVLLQLNLISLAGYYSRNVKSVAASLLNDNLFDYCGSDAHHLKHVETMGTLLKSEYMTQLHAYPFLNSGITF